MRISIAILFIAFLAAPKTFGGETKLNNLVSELLNVSGPVESGKAISFTRSSEGWILIALTLRGEGTVRIFLDKESDSKVLENAPEAMRYVGKGKHSLRFEKSGAVQVEKVKVRAISELMHCGFGFNPEIKSYGQYDMDFLKRDVLPNITTLIVPNNIKLAEAAIEDWHRQGKKFVAEVGINSQATNAEQHFKFWSGFYDKAPFLDGIIINEFIVNRPVVEWAVMTPERRARMDKESEQYGFYGEAFKRLHADERYAKKMIYAYVGGSGKKLNQEVIGTNIIRTILNSGYRVALERYLHEVSSEKGSQEALQTFVDGIADWEAKEPGVKEQMVITFGLFSMPPGGINKQPNVDYHVWMDQQMNVVANHPALASVGGLNWWTSLLADEETVRFVGKLYRHYAIDGKTNLFTKDPLFLPHIHNADFEKGVEGWTLRPAEEGSIAAKSFPRYGRIEGRYMGLGRPADPEHIGDTFLWMKRSAKGPNTFSQTIKALEPGRLYSMKMFVCDYDDLVNPKEKKKEDAKAFCSVRIDGVDIDAKRSFSEVYASSPEPKTPICIMYYWKVFRAKSERALLTVSDWQNENEGGPQFGQEQAFNFLEIEPYHE